MPATRLSAILLDLDGTLTDPFPGISRSIKHALKQMGIEAPSDTELESWIGPALLDSFADHFQKLGVAASNAEALALYRERFAEKGLFENTVYKGIPELLESWHEAGIPLILATAKPIVFAERIVAHFELGQYLRASYGSELDGRRTDKTELLQYILERESLQPGACIMVGDRRHDINAAKAHGMTAIGVQWGYGSDLELTRAGADFLASDPAQLRTICQSLKSDRLVTDLS